jgi:hypothetical protein
MMLTSLTSVSLCVLLCSPTCPRRWGFFLRAYRVGFAALFNTNALYRTCLCAEAMNGIIASRHDS